MFIYVCSVDLGPLGASTLTSSVRRVGDHREDVLQDVAEVCLVETLSGCFLLGDVLQHRVEDLQTWTSTNMDTATAACSTTSLRALNLYMILLNVNINKWGCASQQPHQCRPRSSWCA